MSEAIDLDLRVRDVEDYLVRVGYWATHERRNRHAYVLSPCAYGLTAHEERRLVAMAKSLYAAVVCLERTLVKLSEKKKLSHAEASFLRMAKSANHGLLRPGEDTDMRVPGILKIDMVRNEGGEWYAVEVDTYNPRALGTISLVDGLLGLTERTPAFNLARNLGAMLDSGDREYCFIVSEKERYYEASYEILSACLRKHSSTRIIREKDVAEGIASFKTEDCPNCVFIIPENMDRYPILRDHLMAGFRAGSISTFFPPKAYLGSKAFLPFIAAQDGVNGFVPSTALLTEQIEKCTFYPPLKNSRVILKPANSSGAKMIVYRDDADSFSRIIKEGERCKTPNWVVQEEVVQKPMAVRVFGEGRCIIKPYYLRLTMYAVADGIAGMKITGRPERIVHGAPDCVQLPVVRK